MFSLLLGLIFAFSFSACTAFAFVESEDIDLDLEGYELVFYDEFEGNRLNTSLWKSRRNGPSGAGFFHPDQLSVENGNLVITGEYKTSEYGEGWHSGMVNLRTRYLYGYYEARCKVNDSEDFFSAFWMTKDNVYVHDISQGGIHGAEIDIFETYKEHTFYKKNFIYSSIHCNGGDDDVENIDSKRVAKVYVPTLRTEYITFGLLWTEEEYVFYINGRETTRSSFSKGTSCEAENVIFSLTIPNDEINLSKDTKTQFFVDYLKIYQKPAQ